LYRRCFVTVDVLLQRRSVTETFCMETFCRGDVLCGDVLYVRQNQYLGIANLRLFPFKINHKDCKQPKKIYKLTFKIVNCVKKIQ
jgi:hypothetical protein